MSRFRPITLLATLLVLTAGSLIQQAAAQPHPQSAYIALGDSITFGIGSSLPEKRGYPALLAGHFTRYTGEEIEIHNLAVPGETAESFMTSGQVDRLAGARRSLEEQGLPISLVTLSLGGNEMLAQRYGSTIERQQALNAFRSSLSDAVTRVRDEVGPDPELVLIAYYDLSEGDATLETSDAWWIAEFNSVIEQVASDHNARVANLQPAFRGNIDAFTLHPYDVHPNNQGYRAIARQIWTALGLDTASPEIDVEAEIVANRRTPTLHFQVTDASEIASVSVQLDNDPAVTPVELGDGRFVLLLDLRDRDSDEFEITIEAVDAAGNTSRQTARLVVAPD